MDLGIEDLLVITCLTLLFSALFKLMYLKGITI